MYITLCNVAMEILPYQGRNHSKLLAEKVLTSQEPSLSPHGWIRKQTVLLVAEARERGRGKEGEGKRERERGRGKEGEGKREGEERRRRTEETQRGR